MNLDLIMKTFRKTNLLTVTALILAMNLSSFVSAEEVTLPVISKPSSLQEGIQRDLTAEQIAELLPWAKDSKVFLNDLLSNLQGLSSQDQLDQLVQGITSVVGESSPKNSELLMRYVLNRSLVIKDILDREVDADAVGTVDAKIRVLILSIKLAIKYYDVDFAKMSKKSSAPMAKFGMDYYDFLFDLNKSIFDASAQYNILKTSFEWFQWDLYRDLNNTAFAAQIVKINNSLKLYPVKKLSDTQSIAFVRQMKNVAAQIDVQGVINKLEQDQVNEAKRIQAEKDLIEKKIRDEKIAIEKKLQEEKKIAEAAAKVVQEKERAADLVKRYGSFIEATQVFQYPNIDGIRFSSKSTADGVCLILGYQKSNLAPLKSSASKSNEANIIVDGEGKISYAETGYGTSYGKDIISSITCENKLVNGLKTRIERVNLLNEYSGLNFSQLADANGVCKVMGYESGVLSSGMKGSKSTDVLMVTDENGKIVSGDVTSNRYNLRDILCLNKKTEKKDIPLILITTPMIDENQVSTNSNANGTCKKLGYSTALNNSVISQTPTLSVSAVVDVTGQVINYESKTNSANRSVGQIICIK